MNLAAALTEAVDASFPHVAFAMAYGSSVFQQKNHNASASMIDLVFAVDDAQDWHKQNIERNPKHYSMLRYLGAANIAAFQENFGAGLYYNTLVPLTGKLLGTRLVKYGVISSQALCQDLQSWKTLYLSGRMHKPVSILVTNELIKTASSINLSHALNYALLCLPEKFSEHDLYMKIAGISYLGDFRMVFGENPKKVRNIVDGNLQMFQKLYQHHIRNSPFIMRSITDSNTLLAHNSDLKVRQTILDALPSNVLERLAIKSRKRRGIDSRTITKKQLQRVIASIVFRSSRSQSIKGIATAGCFKSIVYVSQKLKRTYFNHLK
ncbi:mmp37-like protein [Plasmopara halstedii]|uniref:Phosphatidate cytidylyltransferase, mitochondrial n=1 Tax=Plasmopara halstedii TaxID=4781 RepID=A0A0P1AA10_PLAHL|nr:mmp37-like protein [Plasmopara halstedii]CEG37422.1 mmp37-like protein [Plasmopara halstedii]|eukprot:XP_024573791.1 mmp37-like protein [Plasmopara halstedii]